jgi:hypothetical protein
VPPNSVCLLSPIGVAARAAPNRGFWACPIGTASARDGFGLAIVGGRVAGYSGGRGVQDVDEQGRRPPPEGMP